MGRLFFLLVLFLFAACTTEPEFTTDVEDSSDISDDVPLADISSGDTVADDVGEEAGDELRPVIIDLEPYLPASLDPQANVRAFVTSHERELLSGMGATGRVGDIVMENDGARFLIEGNERVMSPCPFGGNIIGAQHRSEGQDVLGEICPLLNAQQTFVPLRQEILEDGTQGYAIVAVTGKPAMLDFFDLRAMLGALIGTTLVDRMEIFTDEPLPLTVTIYYILHPDELAVQVVTALRNDSAERLDTVFSHILITGGDGMFFNPLSRTKGFGHTSDVVASIQGELLPFLGYRTEDASFAYVPAPAEHLSAPLPIAGSYSTIAGVTASMLGRREFLQTLLVDREQLSRMPGILHIEPDEIATVEHRLFVGDGSMATIVDGVYESLGVETALIEGQAVDGEGASLRRVYLSAVDDSDRTMNQVLSDDEGRFRL
ncbi:MAG: hypothetical protein ACNA8W_08255, partial [Bradymonadaceae bacterium]